MINSYLFWVVPPTPQKTTWTMGKPSPATLDMLNSKDSDITCQTGSVHSCTISSHAHVSDWFSLRLSRRQLCSPGSLWGEKALTAFISMQLKWTWAGSYLSRHLFIDCLLCVILQIEHKGIMRTKQKSLLLCLGWTKGLFHYSPVGVH